MEYNKSQDKVLLVGDFNVDALEYCNREPVRNLFLIKYIFLINNIK